MVFGDWDTIAAYLESIKRPGLPSQKEMDCQRRIKEWEEAMRFIKEIRL